MNQIANFTATETLGTQCSLTWSAPLQTSGALQGYELQLRVEGSDAEWTVMPFPATTTATTVEHLLPATCYRIRLRAISTAGSGVFTFPPLKVQTETGLPQPPLQLCISRRTPTSMTLAWHPGHDGGSAIEGYEVQYHALGPSFADWSKAMVTRSPSIIKALVQCARYEVRVRSKTAFGWSEPCNPCEAVLDDTCAIPTPAAPVALNIVETGDRVFVTFRPHGPATYLLFMRSSASSTGWKRIEARVTHDGGAQHTIGCVRSLLDGSDECELVVRATNECGLGPASNVLLYFAMPTAPTLRMKRAGHSWVMLEWTEHASLTAVYELSVLRADTAEWVTLKSDLSRPICIKRNLQASTTYAFRVRTQFRGKWSTYSVTLSVTTHSLDDVILRLREKGFNHLRTAMFPFPQQIKLRRANVVDDTLTVFHANAKFMWASELYITFDGELGSDYGALHREWLRLFVDQLSHPDRALFVHLSNGLIHPSHLHHHQDGSVALYRTLGRALARALLRDCRVETRFSPMVYKQLLGQKADLADVRVVDPELHRNLEWLRDNDVSRLGLTFAREVTEFDVIKTLPLVPGGDKLAVTNENKEEFIKLRCWAHLSAMIEEPLTAMHQGFQELIPSSLTTELSVGDLQLALCGTATLSVHDWKRSTLLTDNMRQFPTVVKAFWDIVAEMSPLARVQLLSFCTASAALPPGGFAHLHPKFTLDAMLHGSPGALPVAHACFCVLELPVWHDYETLRAKLLMAITETAGFGIM